VDTLGLERGQVRDAAETVALPAGVPAADSGVGARERTPRELAREFEPSYETIRSWVQQADRDEGLSASGLTPDEKADRA